MMNNDLLPEIRQGEILQRNTDKVTSNKRLYIESYGCQMNFSDSEIVARILADEGFGVTNNLDEADLVLVNTCSIREKAEQTVRKRLEYFNSIKHTNPSMRVGVLGCMAERLKSKFLEEEQIVDLVVGPDAYQDLPKLLKDVDEGKEAVNVLLSKDETYADISPVRLNSNGVTAFVSITRGCDNMCTFCVVPFTRGRERSRDPQSIVREVNELQEKGFREVTLLGQNVDSYLWYGGGPKKDFEKASAMQQATAVDFADLLEIVAKEQPNMRIRFSTSNPQDMTEKVLHVMARFPNICKHIHLPIQSGSNSVLQRMNRQHTREEYLQLVATIWKILPDCALSQDIIAGFPMESEQDHQDTLSLMEQVKYDFGFMFAYSERPGTPAARKLKDDVPDEIKKRRLKEIISLQQQHSAYRTKQHLGRVEEVLVEGTSKKSEDFWMGRNSQNTVVVFPKEHYKKGDFLKVRMDTCTSATLIGKALGYSINHVNHE